MAGATQAARREQRAEHIEAPHLVDASARGRQKVSVVLPAHTEAAVIGPLAVSFLEAARRAAWEVEVIVVDDGSTDGTSEAARRAAGGDPRVRVLRRESCGGYGRALRSGFEAAVGDWIFFTDGDGQFEADSLPGFLGVADDGLAELIVGVRRPRSDSPSRRAMGWAWSRLVRGVFRVEASDVNCAFKMMRREDVERMALGSDGALINAEIFHKARRAGLRVHERPVTHLSRLTGRATGARPEVIGRALGELLRYRLRTLWR